MNWSSINIGQYQELHKTFEYTPANDIEIADLGIHQMSILKGESFAETEDWVTLGDLEEMKVFIMSDMPTKIYKRFKLNGIRYEFELDPTKLKGGSYMSLMKDLEDPYDNMHKIMFNFSQPYHYWFRKKLLFFGKTNCSFYPEQIHKIQEDFRLMPMSVANPLIVFFWNLSKDLTKGLEVYLNKNLKQMKNQTNQLAKDLVDGVG